ncbi:MAG: DMT family transporter, partial [Alphaproteobacteria bacterium]
AGDGLFGLDLHGLAVIAAAFLAGVEAIITRRATATDSTPAIMLVSTLVMVVLAGGPALVLFWHPVALTDWPVFLLAAATNIAALYALIEAFRAGQASYLAAFDYSGLAFASLWSVLVFAELPDRATLAGAALIVAAGLMVVRGERRPVT